MLASPTGLPEAESYVGEGEIQRQCRGLANSGMEERYWHLGTL